MHRHRSFWPASASPPTLWALTLLFTVACGDGIITPSGTPSPTLFTVRGVASGALDADVTGQLRAALTWQVYSDGLIACLDNVEVSAQLDLSNDADLDVASRLESCLLYTDRGRRETSSVTIESEFPANFNIPVDTLPAPSLLSGVEGARLGLADILVYTDDNGNGVFDVTPRSALAFVDHVHGTSRPPAADGEFARSVSFIVYREGDVSPLWKLYRAIYGCSDPPAGFSTMTLTVNDEGTEVTCVFDDRALPVTLTDTASTQACAADPQAYTLSRATDAVWPAGGQGSCAGADYVVEVLSVTTDDSVCPSFRNYSLEGCSDNTSQAACEATSWDDTGDVPAWWPCKNRTGSYVGYMLDEQYVTDAPNDVLFDHLWWDGVGDMPLDELEFQFRPFLDDTIAFVVGAAGLTLIDNDGNGVFNAGDRLRVREVGNVFTSSTAGTYSVVLARNGESLNLFNPSTYQPVQPPPQPPRISAFASDALAPITDGIDDLLRFTHLGFDADPYRYPFASLRAEIVVGEGVGAVTVNLSAADASIEFVDDLDADGVFDYGDTVLLRDPTADLEGSIHPALLAARGNLVTVRLLSPFNGGYGDIASTQVVLE